MLLRHPIGAGNLPPQLLPDRLHPTEIAQALGLRSNRKRSHTSMARMFLAPRARPGFHRVKLLRLHRRVAVVFIPGYGAECVPVLQIHRAHPAISHTAHTRTKTVADVARAPAQKPSQKRSFFTTQSPPAPRQRSGKTTRSKQKTTRCRMLPGSHSGASLAHVLFVFSSRTLLIYSVKASQRAATAHRTPNTRSTSRISTSLAVPPAAWPPCRCRT